MLAIVATAASLPVHHPPTPTVRIAQSPQSLDRYTYMEAVLFTQQKRKLKKKQKGQRVFS